MQNQHDTPYTASYESQITPLQQICLAEAHKAFGLLVPCVLQGAIQQCTEGLSQALGLFGLGSEHVSS